MDKNDYLNLDMRLLNTFLVIMETGSFTAAANQLNVNQSTVSHGLEKLRGIFQDKLFIRSGRGIKPTPRAEQLFEELTPMMASIRALTETTDFSPVKARISLTIAANDLQRDLLLPEFYQRVNQQVESFSLNVIPSEIPAVELLRDDIVDMVISPVPPDTPDIVQTRLFTSGSSCFFDPTSRTAPESIKDFQEAGYIGLTFTVGKSYFAKEHPLHEAHKNNIRIRVANFSGLASFLRHSDLLVIAPTLLKRSLLTGFEQADIPKHTGSFNMYLLWHQGFQDNAKHQWLREQMLAVSKDLAV